MRVSVSVFPLSFRSRSSGFQFIIWLFLQWPQNGESTELQLLGNLQTRWINGGETGNPLKEKERHGRKRRRCSQGSEVRVGKLLKNHSKVNRKSNRHRLQTIVKTWQPLKPCVYYEAAVKRKVDLMKWLLCLLIYLLCKVRLPSASRRVRFATEVADGSICLGCVQRVCSQTSGSTKSSCCILSQEATSQCIINCCVDSSLHFWHSAVPIWRKKEVQLWNIEKKKRVCVATTGAAE